MIGEFKSYVCWDQDNGKEGDCIPVQAHDAEQAAERFAEEHYSDGGKPAAQMNVGVRDVEAVRLFLVEIELEAHAYATERSNNLTRMESR